MNQQQIQLLNKMKRLIKEGKRRFEPRKDRDTYQDLMKLGITVEEAWKQTLYLNKNFYYIDPKPYYKQSNNSLTFKKRIKEKIAYIKLVLKENDEVVVCWSFHEDNDKKKGSS